MATYPAVCAEINRVLNEKGHGAAAALAKATGVSENTVSQWRAGASSPEPWRWPLVEDALNLYNGRLREVAGNPPLPGDDETARRLSDLERRLERIENLIEAQADRTAPR